MIIGLTIAIALLLAVVDRTYVAPYATPGGQLLLLVVVASWPSRSGHGPVGRIRPPRRLLARLRPRNDPVAPARARARHRPVAAPPRRPCPHGPASPRAWPAAPPPRAPPLATRRTPSPPPDSGRDAARGSAAAPLRSARSPECSEGWSAPRISPSWDRRGATRRGEAASGLTGLVLPLCPPRAGRRRRGAQTTIAIPSAVPLWLRARPGAWRLHRSRHRGTQQCGHPPPQMVDDLTVSSRPWRCR